MYHMVIYRWGILTFNRTWRVNTNEAKRNELYIPIGWVAFWPQPKASTLHCGDNGSFLSDR